ncbi:patatin-like phospholipase family protein [Stieleria varia]|uniref:NTE family protein RssA n=1 Tax=Stieleria varia TaxID=2528005 RepID=A0A5C5ZUV9_9BACT|nr:patatin-like phospholipase family protein [Stieleria varia]TWT91159.1 NTE family protein RssA [Stieleria varia]
MAESVEEILSFLLLHPASRGLAEEECRKVAASGVRIRSFAQDEIVYSAGEIPAAIWLIVSGRLCLASHRDQPRIPIARFGTHDQVGVIELVRGEPATVDLIAEEPTWALEIPHDLAVSLMESLPVLARNLLRDAAVPMSEFLDSSQKREWAKSLAIIHVSQHTRQVTNAVVDRLIDLGESIGRITDDPDQIPSETTFRFSGEETAEIRAQLGKWTKMDRVVLEFESETKTADPQRLSPLLQYVQQAFFVVTPENHAKLETMLSDLVAQTRAFRDKLNVIWVVSAAERVIPLAPELQKMITRHFVVHHGDDELLHYGDLPDGLNAGTERIVHALRGVQIGLALGGGAARGMAHLGVFQALERAGIVVDLMAGTSVGAMLGVTYCAGFSAEFALGSYPSDLKLPRFFRMLPGGGKWYLIWKYRTRGWDPMLRRYFQRWRLEQLPIPIETVSADLVSGEEVIRSQFDCVDAITESINLPQLSPPYLRDGKVLVDGGILNVIPADALIRRGANFVIGVDVASRMEREFAGNKPDTPTGQMRKPSITQVIRRVRQVQDRNLCRIGSLSADVTITPDVADVDIAAFEDTRQTAQLGMAAAERILPSLRQKLHDLDPQLFPITETPGVP